MSADEDRTCSYCRQHFVVPSLARGHEHKHEAGLLDDFGKVLTRS